MKVKSIHNRFTRKLAAKALGACITAGLAVAVATPAQADVYPNYGYPIAFCFNNNSSSYCKNIFGVQAYVQGHEEWINALGTIGENRPLEGLIVTQLSDPSLCLQPYVSGRGWLDWQCTSSMAPKIKVGLPPLAFMAVKAYLKNCKPGDYLVAREHMTPGSGWKDYRYAKCGETLQIGNATNMPLFMDAIEFGGGNINFPPD